MFRKLIVVLILSFLPLQAWAITGVTANPGTAYVQGSGTGLVTIRWSITLEVLVDQSVTITSLPGTLVPGAGPVAFAGATLRRTFRLAAGTHTVQITERLRLDRTSARYTLESGPGSFNRIFTSSLGGTGTSLIALEGRASGSGGLTLQNLDLSFDDGTTYRVVGAGEALIARASVTTSGRGLVMGKWEIAGPEGGFRTLRRVRFTAAGPSETELESPPLPTDQPGKFRLRLVVDGDGQGVGDTVISYSVGAGEGLPALGLTAPDEGANLATRTRFRWDTVTGAARYRIEFLNESDLQILAAVETEDEIATVRSFTLERLKTGAPLVWRVVALDDGGTVIARSAQRRIGAP